MMDDPEYVAYVTNDDRLAEFLARSLTAFKNYGDKEGQALHVLNTAICASEMYSAIQVALSIMHDRYCGGEIGCARRVKWDKQQSCTEVACTKP